MQHLILLASLFSLSTASSDWCYPSQFSCTHQCKTPESWNQANSACGGRAQSPINVVTRKALVDERLGPFTFHNYQQTFHSTIKNNGHSVQVSVNHLATVQGGELVTGYKAVQFHLHWGKDGGPGSEHTIDGEQYPMELHIVHMKKEYTDLSAALKDPNGVAVLGFFYEESRSANKKYDNIINALPKITAPNSNTSLASISLDQLIPARQNLTTYYRYKGSLTTPGCTESVVWTLFEHTIPLSKEQLQVFSKLRFPNGEPMVGNFRPLQPLNGRMVYRSGAGALLASALLLMASVSVTLGLSQRR
ncbi:carbonic anhydrase 4a [Gadus chalcogrammus]|uniref:carbonic anhydrase 4a n=1 Tax=Gadus chalcogrammus TaxID=1042646 RepID=UPI0024C4E396|nr:carbonic anhydrase 4a [Gadus chalcogrammus]